MEGRGEELTHCIHDLTIDDLPFWHSGYRRDDVYIVLHIVSTNHILFCLNEKAIYHSFIFSKKYDLFN